jgi:chitin disaccharide deacetylase
MHSRQVIINADDFGMSAEIDRGILEAHDRGVVTSASLMVDEPNARAAVEQAKQRAGLSLGIHVAFYRRGQ